MRSPAVWRAAAAMALVPSLRMRSFRDQASGFLSSATGGILVARCRTASQPSIARASESTSNRSASTGVAPHSVKRARLPSDRLSALTS